MHTLLRLPLILLETALRGGAGALRDLLRLVAGGGTDERPSTPGPEAVAEAAAAGGARREAERVAAAEATARRPAARPSAARRRTRPERPRPVTAPVPGPEAELLGDTPAHVSTEAEPVASFGPSDDPAPAIEVQAPWDGYDQHSAAEVVKRVRAGDEATRAVVLLYERGHKRRRSVIAAAEESPS
jgi:hypothetical protein